MTSDRLTQARLKVIQATLLCASSDLAGFHNTNTSTNTEQAAYAEMQYDEMLYEAAEELVKAGTNEDWLGKGTDA